MPRRYVNTVPQGLAGTGNATIYGANPVAAQFGNQLARLRENEYEDELLLQKKAEEQAKLWRDNQLAASEGRLWAGDMGKIEQDHIQKGIELRQKGVDPYGVSQPALEYQKERRAVEAQQGFRKATEARLNALNQLISANPDKYEPKDIQAINDFFEKTKLGDAYNSNTALPQLREKLNINEYLKPVQAVTMESKDQNGNIISEKKSLDVPATENAIIGTLTRDPRGVTFLNNITSGIPVNEIRKLDNTVEGNEFNVRRLYKENVPLRTQLAQDSGVQPFTPEYDKVIRHIAEIQTQAKRKFDSEIATLVGAAAEGVALFDKNTQVEPKRDILADQKAMYDYRRRNPMPSTAKSAETTSADVRREWVQDIKDLKPNALERLVAAGNANAEYDKKDQFKILPGKNGIFQLHVPKKIRTGVDSDGNPTEIVVIPANTYPVNRDDPNFEAAMNQLISDVTGARVDLGSIGAKGANLKKSPASTPIPVKAAPTVQSKPAPPKVGEVRKGFKFKGGDPADKNNWIKQ